MPGANCSIYGCSVNRRHKDISIFSIPAKSSDEKRNLWRQELVNVVTKDRVIDESLKRQIDNNKLSICERHFRSDQLWVCKLKMFIDK